MAKCPKCGKKLTALNISQFCPACGVNLRFYDYEKTFLREAKYAELSNAVVHVKMKRVIASFIGTKLAIARLIVMLLPVVALLLPAASANYKIPFMDAKYDISGLGLFNMFSNGDLDYIMKMKTEQLTGPAFTAFVNAIIGYAVVAVFVILVLLSSILCFISIKKMQRVTAALASLGIIASIADYIVCLKAVSATNGNPVVKISVGFGLIITVVAFALVIAVNILLYIKGIPVEYGEGMLEREEIFKKLKKNEVTLDELPQPVVETAETRKIDEEIAKEEANLKNKNTESEKEGTDEQIEKD